MSNDPPDHLLKRLFQRLTRGSNLILSENGPNGDRELYRMLAENDMEASCRAYFARTGYRLTAGDNCFYFTTEDEIAITQEEKLKRLIELVTLLNFLTQHIEGFGEGVIFSATDLASRCQSDLRASKVLQQNNCKGETIAERVEDLLRKLMTRGYLEDLQNEQKEFRVLSAIHYLMEFADRITIKGQEDSDEA